MDNLESQHLALCPIRTLSSRICSDALITNPALAFPQVVLCIATAGKFGVQLQASLEGLLIWYTSHRLYRLS